MLDFIISFESDLVSNLEIPPPLRKSDHRVLQFDGETQGYENSEILSSENALWETFKRTRSNVAISLQYVPGKIEYEQKQYEKYVIQSDNPKIFHEYIR